MSRAATLAAVLIAVAYVAAPAHAHAPTHRQRMTFNVAKKIALNYWAKHDISVPCQPTRRLLSAEESSALDRAFGYGVTMATYPGTCQVLISIVGEAYRIDRDVDLRWLYCTDVVHEIGHIAGLDHDFGGVMAIPPRVPWGCAHPQRFLRLASVTRNGWASRGSPGTVASRTAEH